MIRTNNKNAIYTRTRTFNCVFLHLYRIWITDD